MKEGDTADLRVKVARANDEQAFIEFKSMEGPFSVRVPLTELSVTPAEKRFLICQNCGEAFDSITPAYEHSTADPPEMACSYEGFSIVPESEAF